MKYLFINLLLLPCLFSCGNISASAISMGKDGFPFSVDSVQWQAYHLQDENVFVSAIFPNNPSSQVNDSVLIGYSVNDNITYELKVLPSKSVGYPLTVQEAITQFGSPSIFVSPISSNQPNLLYVLHINVFSEDLNSQVAVGRIFATKEALFIAGASGNTTPLTEYFFNSIRIP